MSQLPLARSLDLPYVLDRVRPRRRKTRVVYVGDVPVGGDEPIRVQSMTTTFTRDAEATLGQIEALARAGCEIVRVTVPTLKDAQALAPIREGMRRRGIRVPLVADIHFSPKLALLAVEHVEKVRINPGNFSDTKRFEQRDVDDAEHARALDRIRAKFGPLVRKAKERGVAMRIGTNHGSLSDRIMNRYGDTPEGMVESALEFVRICEEHDYRDLILSMKASNTHVMVEAYRLLAARMAAEGMDYPFHLGVTEAGDGDDARIKSAIGIGSLLLDGIGDTLRVSLTEDPLEEVPVGFALAGRAGPRLPEVPGGGEPAAEPAWFGPFSFARRPTRRVEQGSARSAVGGEEPLRCELFFGRPQEVPAEVLADLVVAGDRSLEVASFRIEEEADVAGLADLRAALGARGEDLSWAAVASPAVWRDPERLAALLSAVDRIEPLGVAPGDVAALTDALRAAGARALFLSAPAEGAPAEVAAGLLELVRRARGAGVESLLVGIAPQAREVPVTPWVRALANALDAEGLAVPLLLRSRGDLLFLSADLGGLLVDGLGDGVCLEAGEDPARSLDLAYRLLQGARRRTTQTEYISCPGCGRTLFELEPVTARIKALTDHLKGVKIAVMGCIVNGPGEMADADFGYVGWKPGKVNLYVGKRCVVREVPEDEAPQRLVELIKEHGRWVEPAAPTLG